MNAGTFHALTRKYRHLRLAVIGDFCLDRYLEIDPDKKECSIETGLPVHNIMNIRAQPGAAGTVLNNLAALGIGEIVPVGFCGDDGEGFELRTALAKISGVSLRHFITTNGRRTFTYTKPLLVQTGKIPQELNRLDVKNWTPTPSDVRRKIVQALRRVSSQMDGFIVMDQAPLADTGVITSEVLAALGGLVRSRPQLLILADGRRSLRAFPPIVYKMNGAELAMMIGAKSKPSLQQTKKLAAEIAIHNRQFVFVTMAEAGIVGASPQGEIAHAPSLPLRGPIDIVGAGDSVTANLTAALVAGATLSEAIAMANAAASIVIHQLGTTGTASVQQIREYVACCRAGKSLPHL
jgi:rfaE bifunctional protein kinase chain/domain